MPFQKEKNLRETTIELGFDFDKVQEIIDRITAQIEEEKNSRNHNIWLTIDFNKVKHRIDKITSQLEEVQRKFEP